MRSKQSNKVIFCLSHTNQIPQRDRYILEFLQTKYTVLIASWNRHPNFSQTIGSCEQISIDYDRSPLGLLKFYRSALRVLSRINCHCVFTFNPISLPPLIIIRKRKKIPLIFDYMEYPTRTAAERLSHRLPLFDMETLHLGLDAIYSYILKSADGFLAVDSRGNRLVKHLSKLQPNTKFIGNYPSLNHYPLSERKEYFKQKFKNRIVLVYAGSIFAQKGLYRYLDIVKVLKPEYPNITLALIGIFRYEQHQSVQKYIAENKLLQNVIFIPRVPFAELLAILENCHLGLALFDANDFKFKEIRIGNSRKIFTYMLAGLPVVVAHPSLGQFVETQKIGKSVSYEDLELACETIKGLINDRNGSEEMGRRGKALILQHYNWESEKQKVSEVFYKAMGR